MNKRTIIFLLFGVGFMNFLGALDNNNDDMMRKLSPFVGKWKTRSVFPESGQVVHGKLEYKFVLGGNWVHIKFVGKHPDRPFWEAIAMIKFDRKKNGYVSYAFFNADEPGIMAGRWISKKTFRLESKNEKGAMGIDYTVKQDGSIYQENWIVPKGGKRKITLRTNYSNNK